MGKAKFKFTVSYNKKIGGRSIVSVTGNNEKEAIKHAKNVRYTGSDFKIMKKYFNK